MNANLIFIEIAQRIKLRLIAWLGRSYIFPYEWIYLKGNGFPFDIPIHKTWTGLAFRIEMMDLDIAPLVYILKQRFVCLEAVGKDVAEEYAWGIVMDSVSCIWGG